jgi:hypothetical protein
MVNALPVTSRRSANLHKASLKSTNQVKFDASERSFRVSAEEGRVKALFRFCDALARGTLSAVSPLAHGGTTVVERTADPEV